MPLANIEITPSLSSIPPFGTTSAWRLSNLDLMEDPWWLMIFWAKSKSVLSSNCNNRKKLHFLLLKIIWKEKIYVCICTYVPDLCCLDRILEYDKNSKPFGFLHQLDLTSILSCFEYKNIISKKTHFFQSAIIFQIIYLKIFGNSSCICLIELSTAS